MKIKGLYLTIDYETFLELVKQAKAKRMSVQSFIRYHVIPEWKESKKK